MSARDITMHCAKKPVTTMLTYPLKCTVLHCNHMGNTWKPLVLMTRHFGYCPSASEGDNQSVRSSAPVVSRCFPGGYNVKLYISRGRLAWWLLAFLCCDGDVNFRLTVTPSCGQSSMTIPSIIVRPSHKSVKNGELKPLTWNKRQLLTTKNMDQ